MNWVLENAVWILPTIWGALEAYRRAKGSKAARAWEAAKQVHADITNAYHEEMGKRIAKQLSELGVESEEIETKIIPEYKKKLSDSEKMLLSRRTGATKAEIAEGDRLRKAYFTSRLVAIPLRKVEDDE